MFPAYRYMDPHPQTFSHHGEHNAYPYHYHPSWGAMPPQLKSDSSKPPFTSAPWVYNSHINPDCKACCNQSYPPGYYSFRPPYPHFQPPPPQLHYRGSYPPYPDSYPAYFAPPPYYSVDQSTNDYGNDRNHCCGCPNHTCHKSDDNGLKIEEQKPEEQKGSDSARLIRLPNYPHPVVWVPPNLTRDKEANKSAESQPGFWFPLDLNSLKGLRQGEEQKNWQYEEKKAPSPLPILWMPNQSKPEEVVKELKEVDSNPKASEEFPPTIKVIPLKLHEDENRTEKTVATGDESRKQVHSEKGTEKESKIKTVPVKQVKENDEKKLIVPEKMKEKSEDKDVVSEKKEENASKKPSEKKDAPSSKSSKLPPVCLRVDPFPRRKTSNGTSHSPSPPGHKGERGHQEKKDHMHNLKDQKEERHKKEIKVIDVEDQSSSNQSEKDGQRRENVLPVSSVKDMSHEAGMVEVGTDEGKHEADNSNVLKLLESMNAGSVENDIEEERTNKRTSEPPKSEDTEERKGRKSFLPTDAAVLIQSAYRGFEVRKWQPLEKLKKIAHIREQVADVRRQIDDIETSSKWLESKQKMVIGETIMNLLLQLDTIQGLHPSVREIRKSVAKELVCLQEKLDSLGSQGTQEQESEKIEDATGITTSTQVRSSTDSSLECEPNHEEESAQPLIEDNMVKQVLVKEEVETGSEQKVHGEPSMERPVEQVLSLEDDIVSPDNEKSVELVLTKEPTEIKLESHLSDQDQSFGTEDPCKLSATLGAEPEEALKSYMEVNAPKLGVTELPEAEQMVKYDELQPLNGEVPDSGTRSKEAGQDVEECSVSPIEEAINQDKAMMLKTNEFGTAESSGFSSGKGEAGFETEVPDGQEMSHSEQEYEVPAQVMEEDRHVDQGVEVGDDIICQPDLEGDNVEKTFEEHVKSSVTAGSYAEVHNLIPAQRESYSSESLENATEKLLDSPNEVSKPALTEGAAMDFGGLVPESTVELNTKEDDSRTVHHPEDVVAPVCGRGWNSGEIQLLGENEKLREMLERLLEAGKQQLGVITDLNGRVKDLEKKLLRKKKTKVRRHSRRNPLLQN